MAARFQENALEATLDASIQRQSQSRQDHTHRHNMLLLGRDLERLLTAIRRDIEEITRIVNSTHCSVEQYNNYIDRINDTRTKLLKTHEQWEKTSGYPVEEGVRSTISALEISAAKLVGNITNKLKGKSPKTGIMSTDYSKMLSGSQVVQSTYGSRLAAAKPSKTGSKHSTRVSKHSDTSSTALKLRLKTEQAALAVEEQFDQELSERAQRIIARNAKKEETRLFEENARLAEEADRERIRLAEKVERERIKLLEDAESERIRLAEKVERERIKLLEDAESERQKQLDEALERAETTRRKKAVIEAKLNVIESLSQRGSQRGTTSVTNETEVTPVEKVTAYVDNLLTENFPANTAEPLCSNELLIDTVLVQPGPNPISNPPLIPVNQNKRVFQAAASKANVDLISFDPLLITNTTSQTSAPASAQPVYTAPAAREQCTWAPRQRHAPRIQPPIPPPRPKLPLARHHQKGRTAATTDGELHNKPIETVPLLKPRGAPVRHSPKFVMTEANQRPYYETTPSNRPPLITTVSGNAENRFEEKTPHSTGRIRIRRLY